MTPLSNIIGENLIYALGWTILHSLWQCGLIAFVLAATLLVFKRASAALRYSASYCALILCALTSIKTFIEYKAKLISVSSGTGSDSAQLIHIIYANTHSDWVILNTLKNNLDLIVATWAVGVIAYSFFSFREYINCRRLKTQQLSALPTQWEDKVSELQTLAGITKVVDVKLSRIITCPCVIGHIKPIVLLPIALLNNMESKQVELILLHEFAHIRRHDFLFSLLQRSIKIVFFFNPLVYWICSRIDLERENACDDDAIKNRGDKLSYALALKAFAEINIQTIGMSLGSNKQHLLPRIKRLFNQNSGTLKPLEGILAVLLISLSFLFVNAYAGNHSEPLTDDFSTSTFTSLPRDKIEALFDKAKTTSHWGEKYIEVGLGDNSDFAKLSASERGLFTAMLALSTTDAFSHLAFEQLRTTAVTQRKSKNPEHFDQPASNFIPLSSSDTNNALIYINLYEDSNKIKVDMGDSFIEQYYTNQGLSLSDSDNRFHVKTDNDHALIFLLGKTPFDTSTNIDELIQLLTQFKKELSNTGRSSTPIPNTNHITTFGLPTTNNTNNPTKGAMYDDGIHLIDTETYTFISIPKNIFDNKDLFLDEGLGSNYFGLFSEGDEFVLKIDIESEIIKSRTLSKNISDAAIAPVETDPTLDSKIDQLTPSKRAWLHSEEELEKIRYWKGKLEEKEIGSNLFSHFRQAYLNTQVAVLNSISDDDFEKWGMLDQAQFYRDENTHPARIMIRAARHSDAEHTNLIDMHFIKTALRTVVEEAKTLCPNETFASELIKPARPVSIVFENLSCGGAADLIAELVEATK